MISARWKTCLTVIAAAVVLAAGSAACAWSVLGLLGEAFDTEWNHPVKRWPEMKVPTVEKWPEIELSIDPALRCPTPVICRGSSHLGPREVAPYEPCCDWHFDVRLTSAGERRVHMSSGGSYSEFLGDYAGETFDFFVDASDGKPRMRAFGQAFDHNFGEKQLQGLNGAITLNTLDWREHEPIHVRFELRYYYDDDPAKWSTIEVCSEATPTRED
jgi:hypothetical protein